MEVLTRIMFFQLAREVLDIAALMVKPGITTEEIDHTVHLVRFHFPALSFLVAPSPYHNCISLLLITPHSILRLNLRMFHVCKLPNSTLYPGLHSEELLPFPSQLLQLP